MEFFNMDIFYSYSLVLMWYRLIKTEISHRISTVLNNALAVYLSSVRKNGGRRARVSEQVFVLKVHLIAILFFTHLYLHITSKEFLHLITRSFTCSWQKGSKVLLKTLVAE